MRKLKGHRSGSLLLCYAPVKIRKVPGRGCWSTLCHRRRLAAEEAAALALQSHGILPASLRVRARLEVRASRQKAWDEG
jgi:hypothetical protein